MLVPLCWLLLQFLHLIDVLVFNPLWGQLVILRNHFWSLHPRFDLTILSSVGEEFWSFQGIMSGRLFLFTCFPVICLGLLTSPSFVWGTSEWVAFFFLKTYFIIQYILITISLSLLLPVLSYLPSNLVFVHKTTKQEKEPKKSTKSTPPTHTPLYTQEFCF